MAVQEPSGEIQQLSDIKDVYGENVPEGDFLKRTVIRSGDGIGIGVGFYASSDPNATSKTISLAGQSLSYTLNTYQATYTFPDDFPDLVLTIPGSYANYTGQIAWQNAIAAVSDCPISLSIDINFITRINPRNALADGDVFTILDSQVASILDVTPGTAETYHAKGGWIGEGVSLADIVELKNALSGPVPNDAVLGYWSDTGYGFKTVAELAALIAAQNTNGS